jgi:ATP-binding cassette subfamily B multidrug efflux pump
MMGGGNQNSNSNARGVVPGRGIAMGSGEKARNFAGTMKKLLKYVAPFYLPLIVVVLFAVASTLFSVVSPKILGNITNTVVTGYVNEKAYDAITSHLPHGTTIPAGTTGAQLLSHLPTSITKKIPASELTTIDSLNLSVRPSIDFTSIAHTIAFLIGLYLLSALFGYIQAWIMTGITQKITYQFRKDISDKINRIPLKYFDSKPFGDVLSRVTNDVDTINQTLNQSLTQALTSVVTIIGILIMMLTISWQLTIVAILVLPLSLGIISQVIKKSQLYFKKQQDYLGLVDGHVEEMYGGHRIVKVFNGEARSVDKFNDLNGILYNNAWKSQFFSGLMFPIIMFIGNLGYVAVAVLGGWLAINGVLSIGGIQAFIQYFSQFNQPVGQAANIVNILQSAAASAERVFEFLEEKEESPDSLTPKTIPEVKGEVVFDNVVFGYDPEKTIIKSFNAHIHPGQKVAIVGPTGAGKTTMVNLLMRFYDVNAGSISVDGVNIADMKRSDVRKMFGMVLQDTWLFNGTIKENIMYGKPNATEEEVESAAMATHVDHFIHTLPKGYDMMLNEDADDISQGEKQLLTIARAMLANPPMLILDEATSSVDTRTEILIQEAMERLTEGRTSFVIAHRLSTIRNADLILVMNEGNIVEQGKHEELLANNGFYASLYNSQFSE